MQPLGLGGLYPLNSGDIWLLRGRSGQMSQQTGCPKSSAVSGLYGKLSIALVRAIWKVKHCPGQGQCWLYWLRYRSIYFTMYIELCVCLMFFFLNVTTKIKIKISLVPRRV